jgi:hypothetical protein
LKTADGSLIACKFIDDKADADVDFEDKDTNKFESVTVNVDPSPTMGRKNNSK